MGQHRASSRSALTSWAVAIGVLLCGLPAWASRRVERGQANHRTDLVRRNTAESLQTTRHMVRPGETLGGILKASGLPTRERARWYSAVRQVADEVSLLPEHLLTLQFDRSRQLMVLSYDLDEQSRVVVERGGKSLQARTEPIDVRVTVVSAQGVIEKNLHRAAMRAGIPDRVISQMADILGWEFDFRRVRRGDRFRVVYERRVSADGRPLTPGRVLAAEIRSGQRTAHAFYYDDGVEGTYVDTNGRLLTQSFLRYPVEFTRISSVFSHQRLHPILKRSRPHNGVDFAAPVGTPVRAASDGIVSLAGWNGDFGNQVALEHGGGIITTYSHLNGVARGLRPGTEVRQGQVIGWVGQTGLATGPHLHFALFRDGKYLNPLTAQVALRPRVPDLHRFEIAKLSLLQRLASAPRPPSAAPAEPIMLASLPPSRRVGVVSLTQ